MVFMEVTVRGLARSVFSDQMIQYFSKEKQTKVRKQNSYLGSKKVF